MLYCPSAGLERDKFDNKTVTFEEHIKEEHNMWHYLFFIVLVKVKDSTEYTGPESYVAEMIKVNKKHRYSHPPAHMIVQAYFCFIVNGSELVLNHAVLGVRVIHASAPLSNVTP